MAHKKAQWSTNNGRDSKAKRLWVKVFGWQKVVAWNIILRQKGNNFWPSKWVSQWKDYTLFATNEWIVTFTEKKKTSYDWRRYRETYVSVI